ncbi:ATPase [Arthrobacter sp. JZ12]|uniref:N-acetylglucosamine kinase n=1 Tax=Arthrobacter sp. JZ12 TaxID=2654190 RepID=UPI002B46C7D4|nr:BadF/BadG/BcrA/BcrD ATPase family protein [Arthrobacter sp. JZ12]WRH25516.1 ATPase [Arthrobacter sp. JZ12]
MPTPPPETPVDTSPEVAAEASEVIGVDIGGTKTHGIRWSGGAVVAEARTGSANVQNVSGEEAASRLGELFAVLGGGVARVVVGAGGVDTDDDADALRRLIAPHAPGASIDIVHDTRLILAAGEALTGIALIAGTGSVAWGADGNGRQARAGGWGYLLGDEGSAYWVAREGVRATLRRFNRGQALGALGIAVLKATGLAHPEQLIALFHGGSSRQFWAGQAGVIFEAADAGDPDALAIVEQGAAHLVGLVKDVGTVLQLHGPVVVGGGLATHQATLRTMLHEGLADNGFTDVRFLRTDPVYGVRYLLATGSL